MPGFLKVNFKLLLPHPLKRECLDDVCHPRPDGAHESDPGREVSQVAEEEGGDGLAPVRAVELRLAQAVHKKKEIAKEELKGFLVFLFPNVFWKTSVFLVLHLNGSTSIWQLGNNRMSVK